jgi:hypothetical protein
MTTELLKKLFFGDSASIFYVISRNELGKSDTFVLADFAVPSSSNRGSIREAETKSLDRVYSLTYITTKQQPGFTDPTYYERIY